jgi:hypothetical protein
MKFVIFLNLCTLIQTIEQFDTDTAKCYSDLGNFKNFLNVLAPFNVGIKIQTIQTIQQYNNTNHTIS